MLRDYNLSMAAGDVIHGAEHQVEDGKSGSASVGQKHLSQQERAQIQKGKENSYTWKDRGDGFQVNQHGHLRGPDLAVGMRQLYAPVAFDSAKLEEQIFAHLSAPCLQQPTKPVRGVDQLTMPEVMTEIFEGETLGAQGCAAQKLITCVRLFNGVGDGEIATKKDLWAYLMRFNLTSHPYAARLHEGNMFRRADF